MGDHESQYLYHDAFQNTAGYFVHIPMPGHPVGESLISKTIESIQTLEQLIDENDVIFMLTDSRESRWLPTLLGACHNKVGIIDRPDSFSQKNALYLFILLMLWLSNIISVYVSYFLDCDKRCAGFR